MINKCKICGSKNLSDGKSDFLIVDGLEKPIQFCNDCHAEWFIGKKFTPEAENVSVHYTFTKPKQKKGCGKIFSEWKFKCGLIQLCPECLKSNQNEK